MNLDKQEVNGVKGHSSIINMVFINIYSQHCDECLVEAFNHHNSLRVLGKGVNLSNMKDTADFREPLSLISLPWSE